MARANTRVWCVWRAGQDVQTKQDVAVKLEPIKTKHPQLHYEYKLYKLLSGGGASRTPHGHFERTATRRGRRCAVGIPSALWFGKEGDYNVLVIDLLGPSLEDLFNFCGRKFSLKTVLLLADQLVRAAGRALAPSCSCFHAFADCAPGVHPQPQLHSSRHQARQLPHRVGQEGSVCVCEAWRLDVRAQPLCRRPTWCSALISVWQRSTEIPRHTSTFRTGGAASSRARACSLRVAQ